MLVFVANRPGAWLRDDIADILTALSVGDHDPAYLDALRDVAIALGLREVRPAPNDLYLIEQPRSYK